MRGMWSRRAFLRNPLDVLAQQMVATWRIRRCLDDGRAAKKEAASRRRRSSVEELFAIVRSSAPFAELSRGAFDGVLDMLAGRYPSDEFAELRPRITWDRMRNLLTPRQGCEAHCDSEWRHDSGSRAVWRVSERDAGEAGARGRAG